MTDEGAPAPWVPGPPAAPVNHASVHVGWLIGGAVALVLVGALAGVAALMGLPALAFGGREMPFVAGPYGPDEMMVEGPYDMSSEDGFLLDGTVDDAGLDITVGDCVAGGSATDLREVGCDEPHALEAFAVETVEVVDEHPGPMTLDTYAYALCELRFAGYVGVSFYESEYGIVTASPDRDDWDGGDRDVTCYASSWDVDGSVGSIAGSER